MSYKSECPVCGESFERRIEVSAGGGTVNVSNSETACFSPHYSRIIIH